MIQGVVAAYIAGVTLGQTDPAGVDMVIMEDVCRADVRVLALGDSFSMPGRNYNRVFPCMLKVWPIESWSALAAGAWQANGLLSTQNMAGGDPDNDVVEVGAGNAYEVENQSAPNSYYALPLTFMQEAYADASLVLGGPGDDEFFRCTVPNSIMTDGGYGAFTGAGDELRARLLYYCPRSLEDQLDAVELWDGASLRAPVDLRAGARKLWHKGDVPDGSPGPAWPAQINAAAQDIEIVANVSTQPTMIVRQHGDASAADGDYLTLAGSVFYHIDPATGARTPGLYYSSLSDSSWSYEGFGSDRPSQGDKVYSLEQLTHWLDVTTLDRKQTLYVFYYLAAESKEFDQAKTLMEAMIDQTAAAAAAVGITDVRQCLVIPHMHYLAASGIGDEAHRLFEAQRDAAFAIARERFGVCAASIYDATDGVVFDGSPEAIAWLGDHGYDAFSYGAYTLDLTADPISGNLLDVYRLHPTDQHAGAFFASVLGDVVYGPRCIADADGDGTVSSQDFVYFLNAFVAGAPESDVTTDGTVDSRDFIEFLRVFVEGC